MNKATFEIDETGKTTLNLCDATPDPLTFEQDPWEHVTDAGDAEITFPEDWWLL